MSDERTEEATPKKLRDARQKGQVWQSKELGSALGLLSAAGVLGATGPQVVAAFRTSYAAALAGIASPRESVPRVLEASSRAALEAVAPLLATLLVVGTLASLLQVGPMLSTDALAPDLKKLDPIAGIQRLFSRKQLVEVLKSLAKIGVVGVVAWGVLRSGVHGVVALAGRSPAEVLFAASALGAQLMLRVGGAMAGIAVLDVLYQRWQFLREQRMTKDEIKREYKESEGDPHTKQERERLRHEIAQHDALENVRLADVLVVNPTHLAVALRYDQEAEQGAPEVTAKGQDELAKRMIEAAREAGVPVLRDVPLARALTELQVGEEIPEALFEAVAAVLQAAWTERGEP